MRSGLDRLIARVARGQQDVRPRAPTMFEEDGTTGEWGGEQIRQTLAEAPASSRPSEAMGPPEAQQVPAPLPKESSPPEKALPGSSWPTAFPQAKVQSIDQRPQVRYLTTRPERRATIDPSPVDDLPARSSISARQAASQPQSPQQPALVETIENNSIVIEIGRIEVKAPPTAPSSSPSAPPPRRTARLTLDTYLSERRAAKR